MLSSLMGDEWPAEAWSRLEGAQTPEEARAAAADVNAVLVPFVSDAQGAIDDLVTVVESDEFQQLRDTYENLPQWLRDRVDAAVAQAPATVQKLLRAILEMPTDQMASQLRDPRLPRWGSFRRLTAWYDGGSGPARRGRGGLEAARGGPGPA